MPKNTINLDQITPKVLPGRSVKVLSELLAVKNMTVGICEVQPHSSMNPHGHSQEECIYIICGHGHVNIEGTIEPVHPGTLAHFPSNAEHYTANESDEVMRFLFCFSPIVVVGSYDKS